MYVPQCLRLNPPCLVGKFLFVGLSFNPIKFDLFHGCIMLYQSYSYTYIYIYIPMLGYPLVIQHSYGKWPFIVDYS